MALGYETRANAYGSVALGAESVANEENTVSVGSDTLKRKIVNVADGTEDYDAVNVRQLNAVEAKIGQVNNQFTQVDTRLNRTDLRINCVGASAAALASLKPAQLGEDDKFALSLGVGSYKMHRLWQWVRCLSPLKMCCLMSWVVFLVRKNLWHRCFLEIW